MKEHHSGVTPDGVPWEISVTSWGTVRAKLPWGSHSIPFDNLPQKVIPLLVEAFKTLSILDSRTVIVDILYDCYGENEGT